MVLSSGGLTVKLQGRGLDPRRLLGAQQEHHCKLLMVGLDHVGKHVGSKPLKERSEVKGQGSEVKGQQSEVKGQAGLFKTGDAETHWGCGGKSVQEVKSGCKRWWSGDRSRSCRTMIDGSEPELTTRQVRT